MKILHVLSTPRAEGTPNLVLDWLTVAGHEQEVFALHRDPADLTDELRRRAGWYGEAALFQGRGLCKLLRVARTVRDVCRQRRPDVVLCWPTGMSSWVCAGARAALGARVKLLVHGGNPPMRGARQDWLSRAVLWPVWLLGGRVVCCSNYVCDLFRDILGLPPRLFAAVYNCVRAGQILARAQAARGDEAGPRAPTGIMVATMEAHKDHDTLLRALPLVLAERPDFRMRLVGGGSLQPALEALARQLGLGEAVEFLGPRRDVADWLGRADVFVFSTTPQEGFGSVLLEAMAAGLPVVATDCPACRELLAGGRFGALVAPRDPAALARAVLLRLAAINEWQPEAAIAYAVGFSPEHMMSEYLALARV